MSSLFSGNLPVLPVQQMNQAGASLFQNQNEHYPGIAAGRFKLNVDLERFGI